MSIHKNIHYSTKKPQSMMQSLKTLFIIGKVEHSTKKKAGYAWLHPLHRLNSKTVQSIFQNMHHRLYNP